ncbi:VTT domain-containing protein [Luteolibacter pohnpeiensis]|uniref:VTT domain-containing protein n=1 Tax=Luteolibacter pohnpeiensis TaxID=454153 RepID=A0A934S4A8_9BACT|nr:VTT domain-containing protein [Luteolibacter pohnpeiensis]MBK1880859.1 VTT domain-containing protein [Luteolibacter pohnpeiensis]
MRLWLIFVVPAILVLVTWMLWGNSMEAWLTPETLAAAGKWAWVAGIGLLLADFFLPVPGTVVLSGLGWIYGALLGGFFGCVGLVSTGLLGYGIGRLCSEKVAKRWLGGDFERGEQLFRKGGGWMVALSRALPIMPEVICCSAGLLRMPFPRFFVALVCGSIPMGMLFAWVGSIGTVAPAWTFGLSLVVPALLWLAAVGFRNFRS